MATIREAWLNQMMKGMKAKFKAVGCPLPANVRVSCGFPSGGGRAIGQCWNETASEGKKFEIFIHPGEAESMDVAAILAHELVHAGAGHAAGHGAGFRRVALAIGLQGKMTATTAGPHFIEWVGPLLAKAGDYPHERLNGGLSVVGGPKKQTSRLLKASCDGCGYTIRITRQWIDVAVPVCPDSGCSCYGGEMTVEGDV